MYNHILSPVFFRVLNKIMYDILQKFFHTVRTQNKITIISYLLEHIKRKGGLFSLKITKLCGILLFLQLVTNYMAFKQG